MFKTTLDLGWEEIEIEVDYDYQPHEDSTRHYPGCSEEVDITEVTVKGSEICLLPKVKERVEEEILEWIDEGFDDENSERGFWDI